MQTLAIVGASLAGLSAAAAALNGPAILIVGEAMALAATLPLPLPLRGKAGKAGAA